jgi:CRISPR type IV-associated protein Csf3
MAPQKSKADEIVRVEKRVPYVCPELAVWNERMRALDTSAFQCLAVRCSLASPIVSPERSVALDGLLAAAVVRVTGQPLASSAHECVLVEIPVQRSQCGRFHLASNAQFNIEKRSHGFTNKRFPIREATTMSKMSRVQESTGPTKGFRIPREHLHVDRLEWYYIGDVGIVSELLTHITSLGKKRGVGMGEVVVASWRVEPIEPWDGFPVLRDGVPLRPLPIDWPRLGTHEQDFATLSYPYWDRSKQELCAVPSRHS